MVKQEHLIAKLNPVLRGWAQYHHLVVAKETFSRLDSLIHWRLVRWARRRHPNKRKTWSRQKYWRRHEEREEFAAVCKTEEGQRMVRLYRLADTPIIRHQKIKGEYNPFDPAWELYGESLHMKRMQYSMKHNERALRLYAHQIGKCALCDMPITQGTGWHVHHIIHKVDGGSDLMSNLVLLHPVCHVRLHTNGLTVVKPVP